MVDETSGTFRPHLKRPRVTLRVVRDRLRRPVCSPQLPSANLIDDGAGVGRVREIRAVPSALAQKLGGAYPPQSLLRRCGLVRV